jgi:hypothetical protein
MDQQESGLAGQERGDGAVKERVMAKSVFSL